LVSSPYIILIAVLVYGIIHSLLASNRAKELAQRWLGEAAARGYRLAYNIFAIVSLLPVLALAALLPDRMLYMLSLPWSLFALAVQGMAVLALLIGLWQTGIWSFLGLEQLVQPAGDSHSHLVVRGLYRWVRHPLYTAGLAFIWFTPLMTANLLALNISLTVYLIIGAYFEERKLLREFGLAYAEYQRSTPMLVPGLKRRYRTSTRSAKPSPD
jgi:protein-S-isoprenylcysteine O-methyltransferase Ste14